MASAPVDIQVWSDIVCPWCAIGRARLRKALVASGMEARVTHRAFELDPGMKGPRPTLEFLRQRYGATADVHAMTRNVRELGAAEGLVLLSDEAIATNTFDAHRILLWAQGTGRGDAMMDRLVVAHFEDLQDLADPAILRSAAAAIGLDVTEAAHVLESGRYASEVRADEAEARELGVRGVPFFVLDGKLAVSGAQPVDVFREALARVRLA